MGKDLDQFYTNPTVVKHVLGLVNADSYDLIIEPSAGAGDFVNKLPRDKVIAMDLEPAAANIKQQNFFSFSPEKKEVSSSVLTIGNPPFGKNSSTAVKFFNHAATFSDCIAFIVPRTFRKPSVINRLDLNFHLVKQEILKLDSFYVPSGESYSVPTVFQVWKRQKVKREKLLVLTTCEDFDFISIRKGADKKPTSLHKKEQCAAADFCIRRVGVYAGSIFYDFKEKERDWKSHYYIKERTENVCQILESLNWNYHESPKFDTAGNPSISKNELIRFYLNAKEEKNDE
jgi:hypothetical protein